MPSGAPLVDDCRSVVFSKPFLSSRAISRSNTLLSISKHPAFFQAKPAQRPSTPIPTMTVSPEVALAIHQTKAKYCRFADTKQWDAFEQITVPNIVFKMVQDGAVSASFPDRASWISHFSEFFKGKQCHHLIGGAEYEEVGPDEVKAIFAIQYYVADEGTTPKFRMTGGAHYHEVYKRVNGTWLLAESTVESTYTTIDS